MASSLAALEERAAEYGGYRSIIHTNTPSAYTSVPGYVSARQLLRRRVKGRERGAIDPVSIPACGRLAREQLAIPTSSKLHCPDRGPMISGFSGPDA